MAHFLHETSQVQLLLDVPIHFYREFNALSSLPINSSYNVSSLLDIFEEILEIEVLREPVVDVYECPQHFYCGLNVSWPTPCPNQTFTIGNRSTSIHDCLHMNPDLCRNGTFFDVHTFQCVSCPLGFFCVQNIKKLCPAGLYSSTFNATSCSTCPMGTYTDPLNPRLCDACLPGSYCTEGKITPCPQGSITALNGSSSCSLCANGLYANTLRTQCLVCEVGFYCFEGVKYECPPGLYSGRSRSSLCLPCATGTYSMKSYCVSCEPGSYCQDGLRLLCPPGTFTSLFSAVQCAVCPNGTYSLLNGSVQCNACDPGFYCVGGRSVPCEASFYSESSTSTSCTRCEAGQHVVANRTSCVPCQPGHFCPDGNSMMACSRGSYSTTASTTKCIQCLNGTYVLPSNSTQLPCVPCEPGYYCANFNKHPCHVQPDFYTDAHYATSCSTCPPGMHVPPSANHTICLLCEPSFFCVNGSKARCPIYMYSSSHNASSCAYCAVGYYLRNDSTACLPCGIGNACPPVSLLGGMQVGGFARNTCPPTTFANLDNMTSCATCNPGHYLDYDLSQCIMCPPGHFCANYQKQACPSSMYNPHYGKTTCLQCQDQYMVQNEGKTCDLCLPGFYCVKGLGFPCPQSTFNVLFGSMQCMNCALGTYASATDVGRTSPCRPCPLNHYCLNSYTIDPCPENTVTPEGSTSVINCECAIGFECTFKKEVVLEVLFSLEDTASEEVIGLVQNISADPLFVTAMQENYASAYGLDPMQVIFKGFSFG